MIFQEKTEGSNMKRILFLVSRDGGVLKFIYSCIEKDILPEFEICGVIADRICGGYEFALEKKISCRWPDSNPGPSIRYPTTA